MFEIRVSRQYTEWFRSLRDGMTRARINARVLRLSEGNPGDHRNLTDGVCEMRLDFGPGYRVYFTRGQTIVVLLCGGDKASQPRDIEQAIELARSIE